MGESRLIALSLMLTAVSMAVLPSIKSQTQLSLAAMTDPGGGSWLAMLAVLALLSVGTALTRPPLFGPLSNLTPDTEQGATIGVARGVGSLARVAGLIFAMTLLPYLPPLPYLACAAMLLGTTVLVVRRFKA